MEPQQQQPLRQVINIEHAPDVAQQQPQPKPDIPPVIESVLNEWRKKLTSKNPVIVKMAKLISEVRDPDQSLAIESDLANVADNDTRVLLTGFLKAMLSALA
jgi:hypothetical protein